MTESSRDKIATAFKAGVLVGACSVFFVLGIVLVVWAGYEFLLIWVGK